MGDSNHDDLPLKLSFKGRCLDIAMPSSSTVADIRSKAVGFTKLEPHQIALRFRGREHPDSTPVRTLIRGKRGQTVVLSERRTQKWKDEPAQQQAPAAKSAAQAGICKACAALLDHEAEVADLEQEARRQAWSDSAGKRLITANEHLERMLIVLDEFTGLNAEDHALKKSKLAQIQSLLARLDALRQQSAEAA